MPDCRPLRNLTLITAIAVGLAVSSACADQGRKLKGRVRLDGSSTVAPITMAAAEMFQAQHPKVRVTVGISGTGGGFKKFLEQRPDLRTDINDASRPIKTSELQRAAELGVEFIEVPIGLDGIAVVVNPQNRFADHLTVAELKRIWEPGSAVTNWRQVRPEFPDLPLRLYGPGTDSGTFDYFTEAVVGKEKASRSDYTASESDNVLVQGVSGDDGGLGYFGYAYYEANKNKLKILAIDAGDGKPVTPGVETISGGAYRPLSRPMFLYVNREAFKRPEIRAFLQFFFDNAPRIVEHPKVNYVALPGELYDIAWRRLESGATGSAMAGAGGTDLMEIFKP